MGKYVEREHVRQGTEHVHRGFGADDILLWSLAAMPAALVLHSLVESDPGIDDAIEADRRLH
ncbi:MAG: hypothetical protein Ct9H300mP8_09870 [Gammaproteobacteria bacterium]|nr:MAG: hypothetical protein Ct9H300mP8_09870 [Gammaproteobacteria bacterium]